MNNEQIKKCIAIGKAFKTEDKKSQSVTEKSRELYNEFCAAVSDLTEDERNFVNKEIRK